jgi:dTDP-4-amino-4,6-dideoxygalactose transaminase
LTLPFEAAGCEHVYHLFVMETRNRAVRDELRGHLAENGVQAGIHYPFPVHQQPAYVPWVRTSHMTITEQLAATVLSLPLYPELRDEQQAFVLQKIKDFFHQRS